MVDRLLLLLLIVLLPVGIFASKELVNSLSSGTASDPDQAYLQKVETMLSSLLEKQGGNQAGEQNQEKEITILSATVASQSGIVNVSGTTPEPQFGVTVTATVLPNDSSDDVLGGTVALSAFKPRSDGSFVFDYPLPSNDEGILELTFRSGQAVGIVQIDLAKKSQILNN